MLPYSYLGSKITLKKKQKDQDKLIKKKIIIFKFLDPYPSHRLYGDMIFTDCLINPKCTVYTMELYRDFKAFRQIHLRKNGIVFELEDFDEDHISNTKMIKYRLESLGNKDAYLLADLMQKYHDFFCINKEKNPRKKKDPYMQNNQILEWIDSILLEHENDVVFMRGSFLLNERDFRTRYLVFNSKLLEWLTLEDNVFSELFISDCLKIFPMKNFDDFSEIMKVIMGKSVFINKKLLNTIIGEITIGIDIKFGFVKEAKTFFHYMVLGKDKQDSVFVQRLNHFREQALKNKKTSSGKKEMEKIFELYNLKK